MAPPSEHATTIAARLEGAVALDLAVTATSDVAAGIRELTLAGDLAGFSPWPGQDVMVSVPPRDAAARWRRYTVRRIEPASSTITLWVTVDTDGPGGIWASAASVGDRVDAVGPRGKIALDESAAAHLFVVDAAGVAAMCVMAEALSAPSLVATVVVMPAAASYEHSAAIAPKCAEDVIVRHHVLQEDDEAWREKVLDATVKLLEEEPVAAYVFGELAFTRTVVAGLPARGIEASRIAAKPYWREDRANESNGEPPREDAAESE